MTVVEQVKQRLDIVDVVSDYVHLQQSGRSFKANCPFHSEKTPSFYVFPERQSWRCFGACAAGGDVISFVMKAENLEFSEALRKLAGRAGVALPTVERKQGTTLYDINEAAREVFQRRLASAQGAEAAAYLKKRQLDEQAIGLFQLGISPGDSESLVRFLQSRGFSTEDIARSGVATTGGASGRLRDLFRNRLMFPIRDAEGRLVGFGGRAMGDAQPKYLNSPKSPVFDKGHVLYGWHLARSTVRESKAAVIVEGYMDAIAAHQHGYRNVVAALGTALTEHQVGILRGACDTVVLALDPDAAGQEATLRSLESSWRVFQRRMLAQRGGTTLFERSTGPTLKVAEVPDGLDPDELLHKDPSAWGALIEGARPLLDYLVGVLPRKFDLASPEGKSRAASLVFPLIAATADAFVQDHYFRMLAQTLGVPEATLEASVGRPRPTGNRPRVNPAASPFKEAERDALEERTLALLLQSEPIQSEGAKLEEEHFAGPANRAVFALWRKYGKIEQWEDSALQVLQEHVQTLLSQPLLSTDPAARETELRHCVRRLEERRIRRLKSEEELRLASTSVEELDEQREDVLALTERLRLLFEAQRRKGGSDGQ